jgi:hypothetical protein
MIISRSNTMKYTPLLLLSVLSVLLIPLLQTAHAQNPLDQLIGGIKNLTSGASKAVNSTASQAGKSAKATNASTIQSNAASYPGNASDTGNNNLTKNTPNPVLGGLANTTKTVSNALGKGISGILNLGNNTAK